MALYLGHTSAQRVLESHLVKHLDMTPVRGPINCVSSKKEVEQIIHRTFDKKDEVVESITKPLFGKPGEPLDLIVSRKEERRFWKGVHCTVCPEQLPPDSFFMLDEDILVARPELCLIQQAAHLSLVDTIKLAMSFCGIYRLEGDDHFKTIFDRKPVMTVESALSYIDGLHDIQGLDIARRALKYTLPNSGSPMETAMVIPFYLPKSLGGFGLMRPEMNKAIPLDERGLEILKSFDKELTGCTGDAVWEMGKTAFEFQSYAHHDNAYAYGKDYARQLAIESQGYDVHFVTYAQLQSVEQMTELAKLVAKRGKMRLPQATIADTKRREKLLEELCH